MYQVLYRKYRPRVFSDVYGQDHVTSTLRNEINNGRISHAYLFTGSRGTGKTTCAKILAKAVNCENPHDGEPCNECEVCRGLDSGAIYDVVEIDAASNNGVDNIRNLREEANYTPTRGKYRVYIIDEVHMLSTGAFNALLKTLEEPPAHVIFILATTEVHKLPATILSRCQRFDFRRIQPETMAVRLRQVSDAEGLHLDDDAAILIARIADGALRDGLSILDQCAGRSKEITSSLVSEVAGLAGREALYRLSGYIASKDSAGALGEISELYKNSYDMERLCVEMINHFRNLMIVKTVRKSRELIICTDDEYNTILESASDFTLEGIIFALDLFQNTLVKIKTGSKARIELEMSFIKLCEPKLDDSAQSLKERISALERAVKNGASLPSQSVAEAKPRIPIIQEPIKAEEPKAVQSEPETENNSEPVNEPQSEQISAPEPQEEPVKVAQPDIQQQPPAQPNEPPTESVETEFEQWGEFIDELRKLDMTMFGLLNGAKGYIRGEFFLIESKNPTIGEFINKQNSGRNIRHAIYNVTGKKYRLGIKKSKNTERKMRDPLEDLIARAQGSVNIEVK